MTNGSKRKTQSKIGLRDATISMGFTLTFLFVCLPRYEAIFLRGAAPHTDSTFVFDWIATFVAVALAIGFGISGLRFGERVACAIAGASIALSLLLLPMLTGMARL